MKKNVGTTDRVIRFLVGVVFAYLYLGNIVIGTLGLVLVILGVVFILTSLIGFCPLYAIAGINTCPGKKAT